MNVRSTFILSAIVAKLFSQFVLLHTVDKNGIDVVEAAMARIVFHNNDCSAADEAEFDRILEAIQWYGEYGNHTMRRNQRRLQFHIENDTNRSTNQDDIPKKFGQLFKVMEEEQHQGFSIYHTPISMIHNTTTTDAAATTESSRDLWPLFCNDLCAGYVPRRCKVTRCIGYRRRQRKLQQRALQASNSPCDITVYAGEWIINYYFANNLFTSECARERTWHCIPGC